MRANDAQMMPQDGGAYEGKYGAVSVRLRHLIACCLLSVRSGQNAENALFWLFMMYRMLVMVYE